jgi:hypothetical protein
VARQLWHLDVSTCGKDHTTWIHPRQRKVEALPAAAASSPPAVDQETVSLGKALDYPSFGWDNEYGGKDVTVGPFRASRFKVSMCVWAHGRQPNDQLVDADLDSVHLLSGSHR